jgi:hypothetical protein
MQAFNAATEAQHQLDLVDAFFQKAIANSESTARGIAA